MKYHQILGYNKTKNCFVFLSCLLSYKEIEARILNGEVFITEDFYSDWEDGPYSLDNSTELNIKLTGNSVPLNQSLCFLICNELSDCYWFNIDRLLEIEEK